MNNNSTTEATMEKVRETIKEGTLREKSLGVNFPIFEREELEIAQLCIDLYAENQKMKMCLRAFSGYEKGKDEDVEHLCDMLMMAARGWMKENQKLKKEKEIAVEALQIITGEM